MQSDNKEPESTNTPVQEHSDKIKQGMNVPGQVFGNVYQIGKLVVNQFDSLKSLKWGQVGIGILVVLVAVALYIMLRPEVPKSMTGDFRIAVAGFEAGQLPNESDIGLEFAEGIYLRLQQTFDDLNPGFTVTIWGPEQVGTIKGNNALEQANSAAKIAEQIKADILIYGQVSVVDSNRQLIPRFYISTNNFYDAQEITGQHELGTPLIVRGKGDIADRITTSNVLTSRTQILVHIIVGMSYYLVRDFDTALSYLQSVENMDGWDTTGGQQTLYLLIGNAGGKSGNLSLAEENYLKSLTLDPEYSRAYIGLGSVYYILALQPLQETLDRTRTDIDLLKVAINYYEQAATASHQPPLADVSTKVHFGLGQCYFMLVYSGNETPFDTAIVEFNSVINDYNNGANPRIRELAAESHARLGRIYALSGYPERATEEYEIAAELLHDNPERQMLYKQIAETLKMQ